MPLVKPRQWGVNRAAVDPVFQKFWDDQAFLIPVWEGGGAPYEITTQRFADSVAGAPFWEAGPYGVAYSTWASPGRAHWDDFSQADWGFQQGTGDVEFTILLVIRTVDETTNFPIAYCDTNGGAVGRWRIQIDTSGQYVFQDQAAGNVIGGVHIGDGEWRVFALRREKGGDYTFFENGKVNAEVTNATGLDTTNRNYELILFSFATDQTDSDNAFSLVAGWHKAWSDGEIAQLMADPFGLIRPAEVQATNPVASLFATGTQTIADVVNENDNTIDLHLSVDDNPASPDDLDWVNNAIDLSGGDASVFIDITDMPEDFGNAEQATGEFRVQGQDVVSTTKLYVQVFESDESTPLSDEVEAVSISSDGTWTNYQATLTGINTTAAKTVWDAARVRFRWSST